MSKLFTVLNDTLREYLGSPVSLYRLLDRQPGLRTTLVEPPPVIAVRSIVNWHEWGTASNEHWSSRKNGELIGWKHSGGSYTSFCTTRDEFVSFGTCKTTEGWECEIQDVAGLLASKSELTRFDSLDAMVQINSRELIDPISEEKLLKNLAHQEIRILHSKDPSDHFVRFLWDGRIFLMNSGGSHHFAAARYIAARIGTKVPLRGQLCVYRINSAALASLKRDFDIFVISKDSHDFHMAMQSFRATYLWKPLPRPYSDDSRAILLPHAEPRSAKIAAVLREAGFFDLGAYLLKLVTKQTNACAIEV